MENNQKKSSTTNFDHLFGPKDPSTTSSSSTSIFGSIFPPPSTVGGRDSTKQDMGSKNHGAPGSGNYSKKGESSGVRNKNSSNYENETVEPSYYSSSIYYGGQENYSPRTRTTESHHLFKDKNDKKDDDDADGNDSNSASRGNWWQGSLYY